MKRILISYMTFSEDKHTQEKILHLLHPCMSCEELIDEGTLSFSEAVAVDPGKLPRIWRSGPNIILSDPVRTNGKFFRLVSNISFSQYLYRGT